MSRITAERATTMLLALDDIWRYARELDDVDPAPVPVLRWLRLHGLAEYRPPDGDVHPVGEWSASDVGMALGDSVRDSERRRDALLAMVVRVAAGEPIDQVLTAADVAGVERVRDELQPGAERAHLPPARRR